MYVHMKKTGFFLTTKNKETLQKIHLSKTTTSTKKSSFYNKNVSIKVI